MSTTTDYYSRARDFVLDAVEARQPMRRDWRDAVHDAVHELNKIVEQSVHVDDVTRARRAIVDLAGIWLDADQLDAL